MPAPSPSFAEAFVTWCRVAALSFGGPTAQIAVMHRIVVDEKKWVSERRFLHALNFCTLMPGPEAQQLATYLGWLLHGRLGGLTAGGLFVLPGAVVLLVLSVIYSVYRQTTAFEAIFFGLKAAVVAIVAEAVVRISRKVLKNRAMWLIAAAAFIGIFCLNLPFPLIIAAAGLIGWIGTRTAPAVFEIVKPHAAKGDDDGEVQLREIPPPTIAGTMTTLFIFVTLWFAPILACFAYFGPDHVLTQEGWLFSKAATVTFGGAYAVLPYVNQQAVGHYGWLNPSQMQDGLALAETTPGPLIIVVQFVGFLAAFQNPTPLEPLTAGTVGSALTVWVTFVPSFMWVFLGAPYMERLRQVRELTGALSAITAAVVGVVLNLAVGFAWHTFFRGTTTSQPVPFGTIPDWTTFSFSAAAITLVAAYLLIGRKWNMFAVLGLAVLAGAVCVHWELAIPGR